MQRTCVSFAELPMQFPLRKFVPWQLKLLYFQLIYKKHLILSRILQPIWQTDETRHLKIRKTCLAHKPICQIMSLISRLSNCIPFSSIVTSCASMALWHNRSRAPRPVIIRQVNLNIRQSWRNVEWTRLSRRALHGERGDGRLCDRIVSERRKERKALVFIWWGDRDVG